MNNNLKVTSLLLLVIVVVSFLFFVFFQFTPSERIEDGNIQPMLADKGEISLLSIGAEIDMQKLRKELNSKGVYPKISHTIGYDDNFEVSLEVLNKQYSLYKIEKIPAYFVFDSVGIIYKTYKYDELVHYLINHSY